MKLDKFIEVTGIIRCLEGLRIGGTKETAGIGEMDNPIIRHPLTHLPYIPGSSLKGKARTMLELKYSKNAQQSGRPCDCGNCPICQLFGCGDATKGNEPTRLIFRDCPLTKEWEQKLQEARAEGSDVELKTEIAMDRKTLRTRTGSLRQNERIPAGTEFLFNLTIRVSEEDKTRLEDFKKLIAEALRLISQDYLGGSGSRGYGKIEFRDLQWDGKDFIM